MAVTQDAAGESTGKPASFQGLSLFWGASVWTEGRRWKDEKKERKKERRRVYYHMLCYSLTSQ